MEEGFILVNTGVWKNPKIKGLSSEQFCRLFDLSFFLAFPDVYESSGLSKDFPLSLFLSKKIIKKRAGRYYLDGQIVKDLNGKCLIVPSILMEGGHK